WLQRLNDKFDLTSFSARPFSALSYMVTGGISHRLPVPRFLYRMLFPVDLALSRRFPRFCAAFFTLTLKRRCCLTFSLRVNSVSPKTSNHVLSLQRYFFFLSNTKRPRRSINV